MKKIAVANLVKVNGQNQAKEKTFCVGRTFFQKMNPFKVFN